MATPPDEVAPSSQLELIESARTKYTLAMARTRHGPPELALLSLHGSLEDVLRAHGLRLQLPAAYEPFPQLLAALVAVEQLPLSAAEADGIRRMHRLRARVAHGEQIAVTRETIDAYHRLTARLLPRYGVLVVAPEEQPATATTTPARRGDPTARGAGAPPNTRRRERTDYPDDQAARSSGRPLPSAATRDLPLARKLLDEQRSRVPQFDLAGRAADFWWHSQTWLLPTLIVLGIFLIGLIISLSLQPRTAPLVPTAAISLPTLPPALLVTPAPLGAATQLGSSSGGPTAVGAVPQTTAAGAFTIGRIVYVRADAEALNVRARPGTGADNPTMVVLSSGTAVELIGGPVAAENFTWWKVRAGGAEGWCAGEWLEVR